MYTELPPKALESLCLSSSLQSMLGYPVYQESGWLDTSNRRSVRNTLTKKHERASSKTGSALMTSNKFGALGGSSDDDDASSGDCKDQGSDESHEFYHVIALDCEMCHSR